MKLEILFLKSAVAFAAVAILVLSGLGLYGLVNNPVNPEFAPLLYPIVIGLYIVAIPVFFALQRTFKLLSFISSRQVFSEQADKVLQQIKHSAFAGSIVFGAMMPFVFMLAEKDDAPGLVLMGMVPVSAALVIGVAVDILQKLFNNAREVKSAGA
ncbi:MAG: DUF2975 domain-containing protein [Bacillota bacterium]